MTTTDQQPFVDEDAGSDFEVVRDSSVTERKDGDIVVFGKEGEYSTEESEVDDYDEDEEEMEIEEIEDVDGVQKIEEPMENAERQEKFTVLTKSADDMSIADLKAVIAAQRKKLKDTVRSKIYLFITMFAAFIMCTCVMSSLYLQYESKTRKHIEELNEKIQQQQELINEVNPLKEQTQKHSTLTAANIFLSAFVTAMFMFLLNFTKGDSEKDEQVKELKTRLANINNKVQQCKKRENKRKAMKYQGRRKNVAKEVA